MTNTDDPTEVLRAAIAAATRTEPMDQNLTQEAAPKSSLHEVSNVVNHPVVEELAGPKGVQQYFITLQPRMQRCDPAYGVGLEFPISPYK